MSLLNVGVGMSGIIIFIARIACLIVFPNDLFIGTIIYFAITAVLLFGCVLAYLKIRNLDYVRFYLQRLLNLTKV